MREVLRMRNLPLLLCKRTINIYILKHGSTKKNTVTYIDNITRNSIPNV